MYIIDNHITGVNILKPVNIDKYKLPNHEGIYMMADTTYDVQHQQLYYLIKIGYSKKMLQRRSNYTNNQPTAWVIDYKDVPDNIFFSLAEEEKYWHKRMDNDPQYQRVGRSEWYLVSERIFMDYINNGFFGRGSKITA